MFDVDGRPTGEKRREVDLYVETPGVDALYEKIEGPSRRRRGASRYLLRDAGIHDSRPEPFLDHGRRAGGVLRDPRRLTMFCPVCGDEYRPGFSRCADCDVELIDTPPERIEAAKPIELVTVLETGDQSQVAVAKSMLEGAGIPCIARNERLQNLFGWGSIGTGYNVAMGPIRLQVRRENEEAAKELLSSPPPLAIVEEDD